MATESNVKVTPETFIRAESDRMFFGVAQQAGGINQFFHYRDLPRLDEQFVVRINKDTLYSIAVVDTEGGATITVPEIPPGRYISVYLVDNDHYCPFVIYESGTHELPRDTKFLGVGVRIQAFNPADSGEIALINQLQDQFIIKANSADRLPAFKWDAESLNALRAQYEDEAADYSSWKGMMGPHGKINEEIRHLACAAAWGSSRNGTPPT